MNFSVRKTAAALVLALGVFFRVFSEKTPVENLYQYRLDNGLSVFIAENHTVPLVDIEIAVRCGAVSQSPENAGLFHLFEHMMFKGNSRYKDSAAMQHALSDLGVADWNGSTDLECVNYYFTIPSDQLEEGLEFWSSAIRTPRISRAELETEKKVVLAEIQGDAASPYRIASGEMRRLLFPDAPWRLDPSGSADVVKNATVRQLKDIQKKYYVPENAALFVGGDLDPEAALALAEKIYGSWKPGKNAAAPPEKMNPAPLSAAAFRVMPDDGTAEGVAQISVRYRGPDAEFDRGDTYAADFLSHCAEDPHSYFKQAAAADPLLLVPDPDYISGGYVTRRLCGVLSFGVTVQSPARSLPERAAYFLEKLPELLENTVPEDTAARRALFETVRQRISDSMIYDQETARGLLSVLRFWWICADADYYYTYRENMDGVSREDVTAFIGRYVRDANPVVTVFVNPAVYEKTKEDFARHGFQEISADTAFWWKPAAGKADCGAGSAE